MTNLLPELTAFSYLLDAQPAPVWDAFHYRLWSKPGRCASSRSSTVKTRQCCLFASCRDDKTTAHDRFSVTRPAVSKGQEAALIDVL